MALAISLTSLSLPQSFCSSAVKAPAQVIMLRALAFLACAFLLATTLYGTSDPFAPGVTLPPALPPGGNGSTAPDNSTAPGAEGWRVLLGLLPEHATEKLWEAWAFGRSHQTGIVVLGLLTCLLAMLLAGRIRCVWAPRVCSGSLVPALGGAWGGKGWRWSQEGLLGAQPWTEHRVAEACIPLPSSWESSGQDEANDLPHGQRHSEQATTFCCVLGPPGPVTPLLSTSDSR